MTSAELELIKAAYAEGSKHALLETGYTEKVAHEESANYTDAVFEKTGGGLSDALRAILQRGGSKMRAAQLPSRSYAPIRTTMGRVADKYKQYGVKPPTEQQMLDIYNKGHGSWQNRLLASDWLTNANVAKAGAGRRIRLRP